MVNVVISRIPRDAKLYKFLIFLKKAILRCYKEIFVNYFRLERNGYRQMSFSTNLKRAKKLKKTLDGYLYIFENAQYPLQCWLENLDEGEIVPTLPGSQQSHNDVHDQSVWHENQEEEPPQKVTRYTKSPVNTQGADHSNEIHAIDLKIDLVKKQRILMEEETKLLLEKRKLEYLQNFGPNDYGNLTRFEEIYKRNDAHAMSEFLNSASSEKPKLPSFVAPCKEICAQMKPLITSVDLTPDNRSLFHNLLRATLKKRLALILEGKPLLLVKDIMPIYRAQYPIDTDNNLMSELCNTIKTSCWPQGRRNKNKRSMPYNVAGQTTDAPNPSADTPAVDFTASDECDLDLMDDSQYVDLDEYIDLDNDVENWAEDEENVTGTAQNNEGQSFVNEEPKTVDGDITEPEMSQVGNKSAENIAMSPDSPHKDVDEAVMIVDDADKSAAAAAGTQVSSVDKMVVADEV